MKLAPTHTCFDDALDTLAEMVKVSPNQTDDLFLIHAICLMPTDGHAYAHAWVEFTNSGRTYCMFWLLADGVRASFASLRDEYYRDMQVQETTRYTVAEAFAENVRTGEYGPWVQRYRDLCADRLHPAVVAS